MTLADFMAARIGKRVTAPGGDGGQCVDLANLYLQLVLRLPLERLNAVDWRHVTLRGHRWVANAPTNSPSAGDIVVWGEDARVGTGPFGHIAIAVLASPLRLLSVDQNWPEGSPVALRWHNYDGVLGWHGATIS